MSRATRFQYDTTAYQSNVNTFYTENKSRTNSPTSAPFSAATRSATVMAATLRGWRKETNFTSAATNKCVKLVPGWDSPELNKLKVVYVRINPCHSRMGTVMR